MHVMPFLHNMHPVFSKTLRLICKPVYILQTCLHLIYLIPMILLSCSLFRTRLNPNGLIT